jgi:hypothetical protein
MRTAFATLILAAGLATAAQAQTPLTTPATPAPGEAVTGPAGPAAVAPAPSMQSPSVAPPTPAAEPAPPPPPLPTTGDGAVVLSVLEKICVPAVRGQPLDDLAKAAGMKRNRRDGSWAMPLGGDKNYTVTVFTQGSNKDVCMAEVHYALGQEQPIVSALNVWSFLHQPQLVLQANYVNVDPDGVKRVRKSWENFSANSSIGVNFSTLRKPDDSPLNARYDTGMLFYQERKF